MKRDLDLCREILLKVEAAPPKGLPDFGSYTVSGVLKNKGAIDFGERSEAEVLYNMGLLMEAGDVPPETSSTDC